MLNYQKESNLFKEKAAKTDFLLNIFNDLDITGVVINKYGHFIYINKYGAKLLLRKEKDITGKTIWDIFSENSADKLYKEILKTLSYKKSYMFEVDLILLDEHKHFNIMFHPISLDDPEPECVIGFLIDKTTEYQQQQHLNQIARIATIGQLTAGIAHEFNNILAVIDGFAQIELHKLTRENKEPELQETLKRILIQTGRAAKIIHQMLSYSSTSPAIKKQHKVKDLIENILNITKPQTSIEHIIIKTEYPSEEIFIEVDQLQIEQVIMNLLSNARHAIIPKGSGTITIKVTPKEKEVEIKIKDNGIGMDEKTLSRAFDPFFTTKGGSGKNPFRIQGFGLGLAVCSSIIHSHGGRINIESTPGETTEVNVYLPIVEKQKTIAEVTPHLIEDNKKFKVLIVEDEEDVALSIKNLLLHKGYEKVKTVKTEEEVDNAISFESFDVILIDISLKDSDGKTIAKKIKKISPEVKVILMTGLVTDIEGWQDCGADYLLHKPFSIEDLIETINKKN